MLGAHLQIKHYGRAAGPSFIAGLQKTGISLVFVGLAAALLPHTVGILFGRYVLRMEPLIVLGACAGARTIAAVLRAIQDEARSSVPALGYTVPYAIGNILLTAWGPVLVALMSIGKWTRRDYSRAESSIQDKGEFLCARTIMLKRDLTRVCRELRQRGRSRR